MMKRTYQILPLMLAAALILLLMAGCGSQISPLPVESSASVQTTSAESTVPETTTAPDTVPAATQAVTVPTQPETTVPETTAEPTVPETEDDTLPQHSDYYIDGVTTEDVIRYFNEVCLNAEFINSGNPQVLQRWESPISYILYGDYTDEDLNTLTAFTDWLNTIEGFPGIYETQEPGNANLRIHFCSRDELVSLMGSQFAGMDGAVTFWYMDDVIYDAIVCYRSDLDQYTRNSVILEEIYNGLGPIEDTILRSDSIIYQAFSQPQSLTDVDELILQLLYHPDMQPGMDVYECELVIRSLYY